MYIESQYCFLYEKKGFQSPSSVGAVRIRGPLNLGHSKSGNKGIAHPSLFAVLFILNFKKVPI